MKEFAIYLLKSGIWLIIFWLIYQLFLSRETFFKFNRWFLLTGLAAALFLPLIEYHYVITLPVTAGQIDELNPINASKGAGLLGQLFYITAGLYVLVACGLLIRHFIGFRKLRTLIKSREQVPASFSAFGYVFVAKSPNVSDTERHLILEHESAHAAQRHWIDILLAQLICVSQWLNPFAWFYLRAMMQNHEYLADQAVLQKGHAPALYHAAIVNHTLKTQVFALSHSFTGTNRFGRISMMKKKASKSLRKWSILLLLPAFALFLWAFAVPEYKITHATLPLPMPFNPETAAGNHRKTKIEFEFNIEEQNSTQQANNTSGRIKNNTQIIVKGVKRKAFPGPDTVSNFHITYIPRNKNTTANIPTDVLMLVDGVPTTALNTIKPDDIASMAVVKGAEALTSYGEKAKNGVILITTKKESKNK